MNYAIKDSVDFLIETLQGKPFLFTDYCNKAEFSFSADQVFATARGANKVSFDTNKSSTMTVEFEVFDLKWLAIALGAIEKNTGKNPIYKREKLTISSNAVTIAATPKEGSVSVFLVESDGKSHIEEITVDSVTGTTIDVTTAAKADDTEVVVYYLMDSTKEKKFTVNANSYADFYRLRGSSMLTKESGESEFIQFYAPKARPQGSFSFAFNASEVATLSVTFDLLPDDNGDMVEYIYV
jgi:hypothetical protein